MTYSLICIDMETRAVEASRIQDVRRQRKAAAWLVSSASPFTAMQRMSGGVEVSRPPNCNQYDLVFLGHQIVALDEAWLDLVFNRPRGVTVSTLDSESSDRGSNPREAFLALHITNKQMSGV
jgi:hypothetical protein